MSSHIGAMVLAEPESVPIWRGATGMDALRDEGRGNTATRQRQHVRYALLGVQVALSVTLLVASGLMMCSFQRMRAVDPASEPTFRPLLPSKRVSR